MIVMTTKPIRFLDSLLVIATLLTAVPLTSVRADEAAANAILVDTSNGDNWAGDGRTFGKQHFSPLTQINDKSIKTLGLAWSIDLDVHKGMAAAVPLAVDGVLYFAT